MTDRSHAETALDELRAIDTESLPDEAATAHTEAVANIETLVDRLEDMAQTEQPTTSVDTPDDWRMRSGKNNSTKHGNKLMSHPRRERSRRRQSTGTTTTTSSGERQRQESVHLPSGLYLTTHTPRFECYPMSDGVGEGRAVLTDSHIKTVYTTPRFECSFSS